MVKCLQVLGTGCAKCEMLLKNAQAAVVESGVEATVEKVSDMGEILTFGVPTTPALVIDGVVKVTGSVPDVAEIKSWLEQTSSGLHQAETPVTTHGKTKACCCDTAVKAEEEAPCCGPAIPAKDWSTEPDSGPWINGTVSTPAGPVPRVCTTLTWTDHLGGWKARWGIHRMHYWVKPRLYAVGNPTCDSPVFVSANYKMSFDRLRAELGSLDAWILVLDTKGINVWCAAGKGTFGTDELVSRIEQTNLKEIVSHNRVIVPQLGAPGVAAHEVRERSGFRVIYGPVRAKDIPTFLEAGMKATSEMRRVGFPLNDRLAVVPVEIVQSAKWALLIAVVLLLLSGLGPSGYSWSDTVSNGLVSALFFLFAYVCGTILAPVLLPWLPGRPLALKGLWVGIGLCVAAFLWNWRLGMGRLNPWSIIALGLIVLATASFMAMKFTGSTTYTSLSGVRREMRIAVPLQAVAGILGIVLWIVGCFI